MHGFLWAKQNHYSLNDLNDLLINCRRIKAKEQLVDHVIKDGINKNMRKIKAFNPNLQHLIHYNNYYSVFLLLLLIPINNFVSILLFHSKILKYSILSASGNTTVK